MEVTGSVRQLALYAGEPETDERDQLRRVSTRMRRVGPDRGQNSERCSLPKRLRNLNSEKDTLKQSVIVVDNVRVEDEVVV